MTREGNYYCPGCGHNFFEHKTGTEHNLPTSYNCHYCEAEREEELRKPKPKFYPETKDNYEPDSDENYAW